MTSPIPICHACRKADFDEKGYETLCKVYGKIPSKHLKAKDYNCPYFDNENNGWYQLIKDKVEKAKGEKQWITLKQYIKSYQHWKKQWIIQNLMSTMLDSEALGVSEERWARYIEDDG